VEVKGGEVGERLDGVTKVEMSMGEGHSTPFGSGQDSSGLGAGGEQSTSDAQVKVKTYVVVSGVMQRSLPVQVGDRVVTLNGQAVSSWSFWELADKLKHLPLPLTLEFIRTSQYVTVLQVPPLSPPSPNPGSLFILAFASMGTLFLCLGRWCTCPSPENCPDCPLRSGHLQTSCLPASTSNHMEAALNNDETQAAARWLAWCAF
jgi:hypothetical protein